ncbi:MAG: SOS response-associated peptidase [Melioribacteraceae bacterium]|nr:SOS response-associated peptidase [Melioribacteraceae bacterium]
MCGRFENKVNENLLIQILKELKLDLIPDESIVKRKLENIAPTDKILAIRFKGNNFTLSHMNWGIKFKEDSPLIFNSRIETIKEKKYWSSLFDRDRCIVPMSGFYEWKKEGTRKIPYRISLPDKEIFFVPALYYEDKQKNIYTSLITTTPNEFIKPIHHRMPVIFDLKTAIEFLQNDAKSNLDFCLPYNSSFEMKAEPVKL